MEQSRSEMKVWVEARNKAKKKDMNEERTPAVLKNKH